jgi:hypothetical protein
VDTAWLAGDGNHPRRRGDEQGSYPTNAGILVAAGLADNYDTRVAGVIAVDSQHPKCSLVYVPDTGTSVGNYADGLSC